MSRVATVVEDAVEGRIEAIVPVSSVATVVEDAVECRIEAIVGAGKHPEQLLPTEVHLAGRVRVNTKPEIMAKIQAVVSDYRAQGGSLIRLYSLKMSPRDNLSKDLLPRDKSTRDKLSKYKSPSDKLSKYKPPRDKLSKDKSPRDKVSKNK